MQFNLVNDQEQVAQLGLGFISILGGWLQLLWGGRVLVHLSQGVFRQL